MEYKGTLSIIRYRILCVLLCLGVKLGFLHWRSNIGWECSRVGCWGRYLIPRGTRCRRLRNKELVIKSRRMRWAVHVERMGNRKDAYWVLVGRNDGKRPLGVPWRRWQGNFKMDLQEFGWREMDWIAVAQDRDRWRSFVVVVMNCRVT